MATYMITGGGRGFGLALVTELVARPTSEVSKIIVSARKTSSDLEALSKASSSRITVVSFDVTDEASIKEAAPTVEAALGEQGLDVLVNNAGVSEHADGVTSMDNLESSIKINVLGPHWVTRNFLPLLQKGQLKKVANISSLVGSMAFAAAYHHVPEPAYKISKATLNALTVQYALDYEKDGFSFMAITPGWMKTELAGGDIADLKPEQGAKATLEIIAKPNSETNGRFSNVLVQGWENAPSPNTYDGKVKPW